MGFVHHIRLYIPYFARTAAALRPMLKNTKKYEQNEWKSEQNTAFGNILKSVSELTQK